MATHLTSSMIPLFVLILIVSGNGKQVSKRFMWDILTLPFDSQHRCLECYNCNCHWKHHLTECSGIYPYMTNGFSNHCQLGWSMDCVVIVDHQDCTYPYHTNGGWGLWSSWSNCSSSTCGSSGFQSRTRNCYSPKQHNCGLNCNGTSLDTRICDPCNPIVSTSSPTSQSVTTAPSTAVVAPTTTIPPAMPTMCNKFCAISHVASSEPYKHPDASACPDGTHAGSEALPLTCCIVPPMSTWKQGMNVMSNCNSIPLYSPVAIFTFGHYVTGTAGIFTGCLGNGNLGFLMALQTCGHVAKLEHIVKNSTIDGHPDAYFTIQ